MHHTRAGSDFGAGVYYRQADPYSPPCDLQDDEVPDDDGPPPKVFLGLTHVEMVVIAAILAILVALLWPSVQQASSGALRAQCRNNLKTIGLALHNYHDVYESFPPAFVVDENDQPAHSWRVLILPFIDDSCRDLYDEYRFDEAWDSPHNSKLHDQMPDFYSCPSYQRDMEQKSSNGQRHAQLTNYVAIVSPEGIFDGTGACSIGQIRDDPRETLMVADVRQHAVHWMSPGDVSVPQFLGALRMADQEGLSNHRGGLQVVFADGHARFIASDLAERTVRALVTAAGDEEIPNTF